MDFISSSGVISRVLKMKFVVLFLTVITGFFITNFLLSHQSHKLQNYVFVNFTSIATKLKEGLHSTTPIYPVLTEYTHQNRSSDSSETCMRNNSYDVQLASEMHNFPQIHQDFFFYGHCKEYPYLLITDRCQTQGDVFLLLVIKTVAENVERRAAVRSTWGKEGEIEGMQVRRVFLLAESQTMIHSQRVDTLVEEESKEHGDIIQWGFQESFFNITLKEHLFWRWFTEECHSVSFVLKGDDDVFINVKNIIQFLSDYSPGENLYVGDVFVNTFPVRDKASKYFVPTFLYGNMPYPPYAGGGGYLLSRRSIHLLWAVSQNMELFPIDDVYVGMCAELAGMNVTHHSAFKTYGNIPFEPCFYRDLMLVHKLLPNELYLMWSLLKQGKQKCS